MPCPILTRLAIMIALLDVLFAFFPLHPCLRYTLLFGSGLSLLFVYLEYTNLALLCGCVTLTLVSFSVLTKKKEE